MERKEPKIARLCVSKSEKSKRTRMKNSFENKFFAKKAFEMRFLRRIQGVTLFNKVQSSEIQKSLNIEPLLLRIEKSQLRWFGQMAM